MSERLLPIRNARAPWPARSFVLGVASLVVFLSALGLIVSAQADPARSSGTESQSAATQGGERSQTPGELADLNRLDDNLFEIVSGFRGVLIAHENQAILIDPSVGPEILQKKGFAPKVKQVLLTRHDRHIGDVALLWQTAGVPVFAGKKTAEILKPRAVEKYWRDIVPLRSSAVLHFMPATGMVCQACPESIDFGPWTIRPLPLPGPAPDQTGYRLSHQDRPQKSWLICGHLTTGSGKIFAPYTTDWDHWTDAGLKAHSRSIDQAIALAPQMVLPAAGAVIDRNPVALLQDLKKRVDEAAFLKSFERFTKERLKNPPNYPFLAREQAESNGSKPWSRLSAHLWNTGNTFVLVSQSGDFLVIDPWDPHSAKQIPLLREQQKLGKLEGIFCSHAHFDHFDGIYSILEKLGEGAKPKLWTAKSVALPLENPFQLWAPFLDQRKIVFDETFEEGRSLAWREYRFRFHDLPGQTRFAMALETTIDGHRSLFSGDNFFHQDQFSGSGGWMGMNRSTPLGYAASAGKVLDLAPEWVLAEHGGPFAFDREDFCRRQLWGQAAAKAADALCLSGNHLVDWNPHRIRLEPILIQQPNANQTESRLELLNPAERSQEITLGRIHPTETPRSKPPAPIVLAGGGRQSHPYPWRSASRGSLEVRTISLWEDGQISQADCFQILK